VGGAAPVRAVDNDDVQVGQFGVRVLAGDGRVIPLCYLGKEDLGYGLAVDLDRRSAGEVVGHHVGAGARREVPERARRLGEVVVGHRAVGGAEIDGFREDLLLAAAGADGLVVEPDRGVDLNVFVEPL